MPQKKKLSSKYRDLILLTEIGAYLHDIGKLSKFFVLSKARNMNIKDFHGQILFLDEKFIPPHLKEFLFSPISKLIGVESVKGINLNISISHFVCAHHGCNRCLNKNRCSLMETIEKHPLIKLLKTVDHLDASNPANSGKQDPFKLYRDDIFYGETPLPVKEFDEMRREFYLDIERFIVQYGTMEFAKLNEFIKLISKKYFENALSETRKFGNDITLLDHSIAVASLYKAFLYGNIFWNKTVPNSFFDVRFRVMKISKPSRHSSKFLSLGIACCNELVRTDDAAYYIVANFQRDGRFAKFLSEKLKRKIEFSRVNDLSFVFSGKFYGIHSGKLKEKLNRLTIKRVSDIYEGYTEEKAISDIKKVILFAELRRKEDILAKLRSAEKHLANLNKGSVYDPANLPKFFKKEREVRLLKKHLNAGHSVEKIKKMYGWECSKDAENEIYAYFNKVLSPVRPPSPIEMSAYLLRLYNKYGSYKRVFEEFLIKRPLVLGRLFAIFRNLKRHKCI